MLNFQDLTKRIVVACCLIAVVALIVIFAFHPIVSWCVAGVAALFGVLALWEFTGMTLLKQTRLLRGFILVLGFICIVLFFLMARGFVTARIASLTMLFGIFILFFAQLKGGEGAVNKLMSSVFSMVYVALPVAFMLHILFSMHLSKAWGMDGRFFLVFLIATTKMTDIGAYFGGRLMGKRLLCEKLSPKKTWEGVVTGWLAAVVTSVALTFVLKLFAGVHFSYQAALILGALLEC